MRFYRYRETGGCNVFSKVYRVREYARKFQIQDIDVILHRPAGFERTFYSDFTRNLITGGIFIPRRFRRMFMEYRDTAAAAFWLNSTYYATVKRVLHRYVPSGSFLSKNICNNMRSLSKDLSPNIIILNLLTVIC